MNMWLKILLLPALGAALGGSAYAVKNIAEAVAEDEISKSIKPIIESLQRIEDRQIDHLSKHN